MGFFARAIDDADKSVNPAHVIALLLTLAVVSWGWWEAVHTGKMPNESGLRGAAELLGGAGAVNIAHKAEDIVAKFKGTTTQP